MFAYPSADICCELKEDKIFTLIIESPIIFYDIVSDIQKQIEGMDGETVISEDYHPIDMQKSTDLILQFVPFTVNQKDILAKLYGVMKKRAIDEKMYQQTYELLSQIEKYMYLLTEDSESELKSTMPEDITGILKAFDLKYDDTDMTLPEKILEYMIASNSLKKKEVFVTVNLRSYITDRQAEDLFKSIVLKKLRLICIESSECKHLNMQDIIIIDKDMCVI
ncbi:MAG: type II-A CRISPR-associated protein Csn2 [Ruminococcus sp.]|nr:type II-A CRISPR-associated protein Csn2 [Ruminococcus sp.]